MTRSMTRRGITAITVLCVMLTAAGAGPARGATPAADPAKAACGGLPVLSKARAGEIMAGKLTISPFPVATIDPGQDGSINWQQNPFHHPTWQQDFQSGGWIEMLISGYLAGGPDAGAYLSRAEAITKSWLAGVPLSARDPQTVICLSEGFPGQPWIEGQVASSVNYLAAHWQGAWNHGLIQDLKLMRIGCAYPKTAFGGQALKWRQTAISQILSSFQPNRLGPSIDAQGAVNEQATGYENFVYDLWRGGLPELANCGYTLPAADGARIARLPAFLAQATQPDGNLVQLGDTFVEHPTTVPASKPLVAVYNGGYIFGRTAWTADAAFYSLRFGPGRQVHGHDDHMGLTYYARGRNLIVTAGHTGYEVSPYRTYLRSPEAASTFIAPGQKFRASAATSLLTHAIGTRSQFYEFGDYAFGGPRNRGVYVHQGPDFALVLDRSARAHAYQQLWHLDPGLTVTSVTAAGAVATAPASGSAPATALVLLRIPVPGYAIPARSTTVVKGQTSPYQGWVSHQALQRLPAPVVIMTGKGAGSALSTVMLTLITATAPGTPVSASIVSRAASGAYRVAVRVGAGTTTVTISPAGGIS